MNSKVYEEYLESRGLDREKIVTAVSNVSDFHAFLESRGMDPKLIDVQMVKDYFGHLMENQKNSLQRIIDLARYFFITGANKAYIYVLSTINGLEVIDSISDKLIRENGTDCRERIFRDLQTPPLGSPPECYVENTRKIVQRLLDEGEDVCHEILADNHHSIPRDSFRDQVNWYRESKSIDDFLKRLHRERIAVLQEHLDQGKAWFEQEITPEVIELVRGNQEILSAVRKGDYLYITKIPYSPREWLEEDDPRMKRYFACHCPLAREAILMDDVDIPGDWCYCSGGFTKRLFDVLFNEFTEVEVLESVLAGDDRCRFRIKLP